MDDPTAPERSRFAELAAAQADPWANFPDDHKALFPSYLGLILEEVRADYARMRLPFRAELTQPAGMMHGGAVVALVDTCVVPAIGSAFEERRALFTIDLRTDFMAPVMGDAIAEGWIEKRGRSTVFCRAAVRDEQGELCATASLVYKVGRALKLQTAPTPGRA
ncbi:MAG: PaaI family thioesterase [Proteobacteria bacterium]|nr:PaaI family thioesterase [Pseudomonadota bacterium]